MQSSHWSMASKTDVTGLLCCVCINHVTANIMVYTCVARDPCVGIFSEFNISGIWDVANEQLMSHNNDPTQINTAVQECYDPSWCCFKCETSVQMPGKGVWLICLLGLGGIHSFLLIFSVSNIHLCMSEKCFCFTKILILATKVLDSMEWKSENGLYLSWM